MNPTSNSVSNTAGTTVGPAINPDSGFDNTSGLTANGSTEFAEERRGLTDDDDQTGSVFTEQPDHNRQLHHVVPVRLHEGTQPTYADGIAFVIQAIAPTALGLGFGAMGYQTIGNSIAIKLDPYQNAGDPSDSSTGLFEDGCRADSSGIDTTSNDGPLIDSQATKLVTLSYDGTTLTETITNTLDPTQIFTTSYKVNIPAVIGSDTAYVGFTGSTGDGSYWELQDVTGWTFTSTAPLPGAPTALKIVNPTSSTEIDLSWTSNSYNETGFAIYRSGAGGNFVQIGTATYELPGHERGRRPHRYRVAAINANGTSANTNTVVVTATPTITWTGPASITYGTALGSAQLDATASVAGTFAYTPAAGTVLHAGSNQTLSVVFTPTDTTDYTHATATATISVSQATPTINWASPASLTYGAALRIGPARCDCVGGRHVCLYSGRGHDPPCRRQSDAVRTVHAHRYDRLHDRERHDDDQRLASDTDDHLDWPGVDHVWHGAGISPARCECVGGRHVCLYSGGGHGPPCRRQSDAVRTVHAHRYDRLHDRDRHDDDQRLTGDADDHLDWPGVDHVWHGAGISPARCECVGGRHVCLYSGGGHGPRCRRQSDAVRTVHAHRYDRLHDRDRHDDDQRLTGDTGDHLAWPGVDHVWHGAGISPARWSASAAGTFAYTPAAGTVLHAGDNQTLSVLFTPTDLTDYTTATATTTISVSQATPTITWHGPASITYGTALGSAQLDASASAAGTFAYTPAAGTVLDAGDNQTLSVVFTPTDTTDYTTASATTTISVSQATPAITWHGPASITYGTALDRPSSMRVRRWPARLPIVRRRGRSSMPATIRRCP